jgi:phosphotransferase system  glucose/maltose/N-acetylglucosamine-specific IIC component
VQVLQSSARSDKHLQRSFGFMIAMLIAQVGVTIASLAMAMKRKVPVWAVAAMSGVVAILFGVYVFLEIGPLK